MCNGLLINLQGACNGLATSLQWAHVLVLPRTEFTLFLADRAVLCSWRVTMLHREQSRGLGGAELSTRADPQASLLLPNVGLEGCAITVGLFGACQIALGAVVPGWGRCSRIGSCASWCWCVFTLGADVCVSSSVPVLDPFLAIQGQGGLGFRASSL